MRRKQHQHQHPEAVDWSPPSGSFYSKTRPTATLRCLALDDETLRLKWFVVRRHPWRFQRYCSRPNETTINIPYTSLRLSYKIYEVAVLWEGWICQSLHCFWSMRCLSCSQHSSFVNGAALGAEVVMSEVRLCIGRCISQESTSGHPRGWRSPTVSTGKQLLATIEHWLS